MMEVMLALIAPIVALLVMFLLTEGLFWMGILFVEFVTGATDGE
jgi:hypothetical protein